MAKLDETVQKTVDQAKRNGQSGFDRSAYNAGTSQYREAVDAATNKKK